MQDKVGLGTNGEIDKRTPCRLVFGDGSTSEDVQIISPYPEENRPEEIYCTKKGARKACCPLSGGIYTQRSMKVWVLAREIDPKQVYMPKPASRSEGVPMLWG